MGKGDLEGAGKFDPLWSLAGRRDVGLGWGRETRRVCDSVGGVKKLVSWTPYCLRDKSNYIPLS